MGYVPIRDENGDVTEIRFIPRENIGTPTREEAVSEATQTDEDRGRSRPILPDASVPGEDITTPESTPDSQARSRYSSVQDIRNAIQDGRISGVADATKELEALFRSQGNADPFDAAQATIRTFQGQGLLPGSTSAPSEGSFIGGDIPGDSDVFPSGGLGDPDQLAERSFSFRDIFDQFVARQAGSINPEFRSALNALQPGLFGQFVLSGTGNPSDPEDPNPFRTFLEGGRGLSGEGLRDRFGQASFALDRFLDANTSGGSTEALFGSDPLSRNLGLILSSVPSTQLPAAQALLQGGIAPQFQGALNNAVSNSFDAFRGDNPTGNFLRFVQNRGNF